MKAAKRSWLALVLASGLALGEGAPPAAEHAAPESDPAPPAAPGSPPPPERVIDLDFSEDFPAPNRAHAAGTPGIQDADATRKLPPSAAMAPTAPSGAWAYWTAGIATLAAGGAAAWYLHWGARTPPDPVRDNQVFTDEAD